jgi:hypothetical protein
VNRGIYGSALSSVKRSVSANERAGPGRSKPSGGPVSGRFRGGAAPRSEPYVLPGARTIYGCGQRLSRAPEGGRPPRPPSAGRPRTLSPSCIPITPR